MHKLMSFVKLEYLTLKPYIFGKYLLIYAAMALFVTMTSGTYSAGMALGAMLAVLYVGHPFSISEKGNLDALYATLSLKRGQVVGGRYLFMLLFNVCAIIALSAIGFAGMFLSSAFLGMRGSSADSPLLFTILAAFFIAMQAVQMPLYFKFGFEKAKFMSFVPFAAIIAIYVAVFALSGTFAGVQGFISGLGSNAALLAAVAISAIALLAFLSYRLSVSFYQKREF